MENGSLLLGSSFSLLPPSWPCRPVIQLTCFRGPGDSKQQLCACISLRPLAAEEMPGTLPCSSPPLSLQRGDGPSDRAGVVTL